MNIYQNIVHKEIVMIVEVTLTPKLGELPYYSTSKQSNIWIELSNAVVAVAKFSNKDQTGVYRLVFTD